MLTVEFGNATLGSQASKHAEAFRRGQKMAALTDVANIILEEVSLSTVHGPLALALRDQIFAFRRLHNSVALHDRAVGLLVPAEPAVVTLA